MKVTTPVGELELPTSVRQDVQVKYFRHVADNTVLVAAVRWDDQCKNGHNHFSVTATQYESRTTAKLQGVSSVTWHQRGLEPVPLGFRDVAGGCLHDEIARAFPSLAPLIPYHLMTATGPMHYFANTVYLAGDRDCWGYRKNEQKRDKRGWPMWNVPYDVAKNLGISTLVAAVDAPHYRATPWLMEGKERELDAARRAAIWPEATDEELSLPSEQLQQKLHDRLPALMVKFESIIETMGFTY